MIQHCRYLENHVISRPYQGRIGLAIAGWMHGGGPGTLTRTSSHMNAAEYLRILHDQTLPSIRATLNDPQIHERLFLMQDNSPVHTAMLVRHYLRTQQDIQFIPMPALSPDMNPIENLWARMFRECPQNIPRSQDALWWYCLARWELFNNDPQLFREQTHSMKRRLEAVLEAQGGHTKY